MNLGGIKKKELFVFLSPFYKLG